jgi:hypothetical protein
MAKFKFKFTNPVLTKFFSTSPQAVAWDADSDEAGRVFR